MDGWKSVSLWLLKSGLNSGQEFLLINGNRTIQTIFQTSNTNVIFKHQVFCALSKHLINREKKEWCEISTMKNKKTESLSMRCIYLILTNGMDDLNWNGYGMQSENSLIFNKTNTLRFCVLVETNAFFMRNYLAIE